MTIKTVAVTGASGFVGQSVVRELLAQGYSVRALVRSREKARKVLPSGIVLVSGDISEAGKAEELLAGCEACINLLGIIREVRGSSGQRSQTFQRLHVDATRLLVARAQAKGVRRYVQMSAINATDVGVSEYQRTKFEAEMVVRLSDLDWTIFRPALIHGPRGEFTMMAKEWSTGHTAPFFFMPYFTRQVEDKRVPLGTIADVDPKVAPVSVDDVAKSFAACLTNPKTIGEVYNLAGSETLAWPAMLRYIRDNVHGAHDDQPAWGIPSTLAAAGAKAAAFLGMGGLLPFDEGMAKMGAQDATATLDKFRAHFGFEPAGFRASFREYAGTL